jgi:putative ABC transport system permease protein
MKNNLKIAWRILLRDKGYSVINVGGFTVGLTAVMFIGLWVYDELSFNKSHIGYNRIGQVMVHNGPGTYKTHPIPLADELRSSFPEDFESIAISTQPQNYTVTFQDKTFKEVGNFAELDFIKMVAPNFLLGNESDFSTPNSILLSETLYKKLFEDSNPINNSIRINNEMDLIGHNNGLASVGDFACGGIFVTFNQFCAVESGAGSNPRPTTKPKRWLPFQTDNDNFRQ